MKNVTKHCKTGALTVRRSQKITHGSWSVISDALLSVVVTHDEKWFKI